MSDPTPADSQRQRFLTILSVIVLVGFVLRLAGTLNDLFIDEVWSVYLTGRVGSIGDIFFRLKHDNNHWLNSAWLYLNAGTTSPTLLRLPAVILGTAAVALTGLIARRMGQKEAILATVFVACSCFLVNYGSEARGYAGAMGFGLLAVWLADRFFRRPTIGWGAAYVAAAAIGCLWHLTAVMALIGIAVWTARRKQWLPWLLAHAAIGGFIVALYFTSVRGMDIGGGIQAKPWMALLDAAAVPFGASGTAAVAGVAVVAVGLAIAGAVLLYRGGSDLWLLCTAVVIGGPLVMIGGPTLLSRPVEHHHARYLLVVMPFLILLISHALAMIGRQGRAGMLVPAVAVIAFVAANAVQLHRFLRDGRGQYVAAMLDLADVQPTGPIVMTSDNDFRNPMMLSHYRPQVWPDRELQYLPGNDPRADWRLVHRFELDLQAPPAGVYQLEPGGPRYRFAGIYRHGGPSGWTWLVFKRL